MNRYTIYCTEEQTRKALELGAPIDTCDWREVDTDLAVEGINEKGWHINYKKPTAEQMIGWLESHDTISSIEIGYDKTNKVWIYFFITLKEEDSLCRSLFPSRPEATLTAIDAALEYLIHHKNDK